MKNYNVRIKMPVDVSDGIALHKDLIKYEGYGSVQYQTWQKIYQNDNSKYHGGFNLIFTFNDETNAHKFNNIWDKDTEEDSL